MKGMKY